jgi:hypothetical protein
MRPLPGHGGSKLEHGVNGIEECAIPMVFQNAPAPLNRVVLAVVRWIIGETHRHVILLYKLHHPLHELGTATMVFRTIIPIQNQRRNVGKPRADGLPPLHESVRQAVTGPFGGHPIHKQFIKRREEDADGGERGGWLKVVIDCCDQGTTFAPAREGTNFDGSFGIHGDA